jgi:hypothetical protein
VFATTFSAGGGGGGLIGFGFGGAAGVRAGVGAGGGGGGVARTSVGGWKIGKMLGLGCGFARRARSSTRARSILGETCTTTSFPGFAAIGERTGGTASWRATTWPGTWSSPTRAIPSNKPVSTWTKVGLMFLPSAADNFFVRSYRTLNGVS